MEDEEDNFQAVYTRTLWAPLTKIFPPHSNNPFHRQIARALVLYEDIRLEVSGMSADRTQLTRLDLPSHRYREMYFIRRSMVTMLEFVHAIHDLQTSPTFKTFKAQSDPGDLKPWIHATKFFSEKRTEIKEIRDAVGGHFGVVAARSAVSQASLDYVAKVEVQFDSGEKRRVISHFTEELVATALLEQCFGSTQDESVSYLMALILEANKHAANASHFLLVEYVWPLFER